MKRLVYAISIIAAILLFTANSSWAKKDKFVDSSEYKEKKEPIGFIKNYEGMEEGDDIKWVYVKSIAEFRKYKSITVEPFGTIADRSNKEIQTRMKGYFEEAFERIGKKITKSGELTAKGALYIVEDRNAEKKAGVRYIPFAGIVLKKTEGNPTVGVEIIIIDARTKEEIARIRHKAQDSSLKSAAKEVADDIANYFKNQ